MRTSGKSGVQRKRKPKVTVSTTWSNQELLELVKHVAQYKCIYEKDCAENKILLRRRNAWQSISTAFDHKFSPQQCTAKWMVLRSTHRRLLAEKKKNPDFEPGWPLFSSMIQLIPLVKNDSVASMCTEETENLSGPETTMIQSDQTPAMPSVSVSTTNATSTAHSSMSAVHNAEAIENEFDIFGLFVASELKSIALVNVYAARNLKVKLQMELASGVMEWLNGTHPQHFQIIAQQPIAVQSIPQTENTSIQPSSDEFDSNFEVFGEGGEKFDARRHKTMSVFYSDKNVVADLKTHKYIANIFGVYVDCADNYDLSNGAPVRWIEGSDSEEQNEIDE